MTSTTTIRACSAVAATLLLASFGAPAFAEAYIPRTDAEVLETVPAAARLRSVQPLRKALATNPNDPTTAAALAKEYLEIGRSTADPRFVSYAQSVLTPWAARADATADILVLAAIAQQSSHRFAEALSLLDRALRAEPANSQAWLTKATIHQVQGDFAAARKACARLITTAGQLLAVTCLANADSMVGKLRESRDALQRIFTDDSRLAPQLRSWVLGSLGEMTVRLGDEREAERIFQTALAIDAEDFYIRGEYADLLLRQGRDAEVVQLLEDNEPQDALLLRLAIVGARLNTTQGRRWMDAFDTRSKAAERSGDGTHQRERARFLLEARHDAAGALPLALLNWQVQREPADIRLLAEVATRSRDLKAGELLTSWVKTHGYQDRLLPTSSP